MIFLAGDPLVGVLHEDKGDKREVTDLVREKEDQQQDEVMGKNA